MRVNAPITAVAAGTEMVHGVILAAGGSTRMGRPKALLDVGGRCLLRAHVDAMEAAGLRVIVILGFEEIAHRAVLPESVEVRVNPAWKTTSMMESAEIGLAGVGTAILTPVDVPPASVRNLARLLAAQRTAFLCHQGVAGHPIRLSPPHIREKLSDRMKGALPIETDDESCLMNLNTPADWAAWRKKM